MTTETGGTAPGLSLSFHGASKACSAAVTTLGLLVLGAWAFDIAVLKSVHPSFVAMKANAAFLFVLLGISLWSATRNGSTRIRHACALIVTVIAALTAAEYALHIDLGLDQVLFRDTASAALAPGRMTPATTLAFLLMGLALLLLDVGKRHRPSDVAVMLAAAIALLSLCGYLYGAPSLYRIGPYGPSAIHTSVGFLGASLAFFLARPDEGVISILASDTAAATLLRWLLPAAAIVPLVLGWLRLRGQEQGLYDTTVGAAILIVANIVFLATAVSLIASSWHVSELKRRQAEQAAAGNARLQQLVEGSPYAVAMLDRSMRYVFVSTRWLSDFRLDLTKEQVRGRSHYDVFPGSITEHLKQIHLRCLAGEVAHNDAEAFIRDDGTVDWIRWEIRPWRDDHGEIGGILIFSEDISARKRAEESLRQSEARKAAILDSALDAIVSIDHDGAIVEFNPAAERIFGYRRDDVLGRPVVKLLVPPSLRQAHQAGFAKYLETGEGPILGQRLELPALRADGSEFPVELAVNPVKGQSPPLFTAFIRDISERKQAAAQFHLAIEAAPTGMIMVDPNGKIVLVNAQIERLFGFGREELIGQTVEILVPERFRARHPGFRKGFFSEPRFRAMGAGRDLYGLRKDGVEFPVEIGLNPIRTPEGLFVLSSVVDISERKRAEREREDLMSQLQTLNANLEERVRGRTSELMASVKEREVLLQEVHHRVKNNLQVISSLINMQLRQLDEPATREALQECQSRVQSIALIHEKLHHAREYARVPFSEYARSLAGNIFDTSGTSPSRVALQMDIENISVAVDRAIPCGLILNELISNALKHAFPADRSGVVRVELRRTNAQRLLLVVGDNGVGMKASLDPHNSSTLGMQLVNTLVEQLDGRLEIIRNHGTTFRIELPAEA